MNSTPVRIAGFVVGLAALFAVALGVGRLVGPIDQPDPAAHATDGHDDGHGDDGGHDGHESGTTDASLPGGLAVSENGYTLRLADGTAETGRRVPVAFVVEGPDGAPVTAYDVEHEKRLHFIAVRRDGTGFQHLHPTLAGDGTWRTRLALTPGDWRVFADFNPTGGTGTTLGADLAVAGDYRPAEPTPVSTTTTVDDYTVTLDGHLEPGADARLTLSVSRDGRPVTDLQPYLGAYGHLVALREGDLAYLHVHPEGAPRDGATKPGPDVVFYAEVPSAGRYRLFLDFQHDGQVHTAEFTVDTHEDHP